MAAPRDFPQKNTTFRSEETGVVDIPAHRGDDGVVTSKWVISDTELAEIIRTRCVWLRVAGPMYPTSITGLSPFKADPLLRAAEKKRQRHFRRGDNLPIQLHKRAQGRVGRVTRPMAHKMYLRNRPWGEKK